PQSKTIRKHEVQQTGRSNRFPPYSSAAFGICRANSGLELSHHLERRHRRGRILDVASSVPNQEEGTRLDRRIPTKRIQGYCPPLIPEVRENWPRYECDPGLLIVDYASIAGTCRKPARNV